MKNKFKISILAMLSAVVLYSCTKYPDLYDDERIKDVTITYYDDDADFTKFKTYSIVDTVGNVVKDGKTNKVVPSEYSEVILTHINNNMASLGYTKVDTSAKPDLLINAHTLAIEVEHVGSYYPYYGYGGGYYWGYPGYGYSYPYYYSYDKSFGSVTIEMANRNKIDHGANKIPVVWTALILGATNTTSNATTRITNGIDEAFAQSPYLAK